MSTYLNGYTLLEKVRILLNEYSTAYAQAIDTAGKYQNSQIMDGINAAQRYLYNILFTRMPQLFEEEIALTGVSSVYTLPANFARLRYFKDSDGYQIFPIGTSQRKLTADTGSDRLYYRKGNTLVLDKPSLTDICTLVYYRKPREIEQGVSSAGGALSVTLATTSKAIIDYYNGLTIENITDSTVDVITDYTAARVCTVSNTWAASKYYGTVSDIPEMFHFLMIPRAVFEITGIFPMSKDFSRKTGYELFNEDLLGALRAYTGGDLDTYPEDIWTNYGEATIGYSVNLSD